MKIAAVLPAYNEAERIADVIRAVRKARWIDQIIVVDDGSEDNTAEVAASFPDVIVVTMKVNRGKGAAMTAGVEQTDADIIVFLDADLIGLRPEHVDALVNPVRTGRAEMVIGKFRGGRRLTDLSQRLAPNINGQRAILRCVFDQIPNLHQTRYGVEMAITRFCRYYRIETTTVCLHGVTHPMKEEKLGLLRGWASRGAMYAEILRIMLDPRRPRRRKPRMHRFWRRISIATRRTARTHASPSWLQRPQAMWRRKRERSRFV